MSIKHIKGINNDKRTGSSSHFPRSIAQTQHTKRQEHMLPPLVYLCWFSRPCNAPPHPRRKMGLSATNSRRHRRIEQHRSDLASICGFHEQHIAVLLCWCWKNSEKVRKVAKFSDLRKSHKILHFKHKILHFRHTKVWYFF